MDDIPSDYSVSLIEIRRRASEVEGLLNDRRCEEAEKAARAMQKAVHSLCAYINARNLT